MKPELRPGVCGCSGIVSGVPSSTISESATGALHSLHEPVVPSVRALVIPVVTNALISGHTVDVLARVSSSGIFEWMHQARNRAADAGQARVAPDPDGGQQRPQLLLRDVCGQDLSVGISSTIAFHILANFVSDSRSRAASSRRRFAHSGSILPPQRSLGFQRVERAESPPIPGCPLKIEEPTYQRPGRGLAAETAAPLPTPRGRQIRRTRCRKSPAQDRARAPPFPRRCRGTAPQSRRGTATRKDSTLPVGSSRHRGPG